MNPRLVKCWFDRIRAGNPAGIVGDRRTWVAATLVWLVATPAIAHKVQIQNDVGATLHIVPNDIPTAGAATDVWFALTKAGGTGIPLTDCECALTVYGRDDTAIATPTLTPVAAEGYESIPGASVTFPAVGTYELVLSGSPKEDAQFTAFELSFEVTVAGSAAPTDPVPAPQPAEPSGQAAPSEDRPNALAEAAHSSETPEQTPTSISMKYLAVLGGAAIIISIVGVIFVSARSLGEKS